MKTRLDYMLDVGLQPWQKLLVLGASEVDSALAAYLYEGRQDYCVASTAQHFTASGGSRVGMFDEQNGSISGLEGTYDYILIDGRDNRGVNWPLRRLGYHLGQVAGHLTRMIWWFDTTQADVVERFETVCQVHDWEKTGFYYTWLPDEVRQLAAVKRRQDNLDGGHKDWPTRYVVKGRKQVGKEPNFRACLRLARAADDHYSMSEPQQKIVYEQVMSLPEGSVVVELGVAYGKTATVVAYGAWWRKLTYFAVDNFSLVGTPPQFIRRFERMGLPIHLLVGDTGTVPWEQEIDLLIVDAGHDEANIEADCEYWLPWLKPGGTALFHDYMEPGKPGIGHSSVTRVVERNTRSWRDGWYLDGLKQRIKPVG